MDTLTNDWLVKLRRDLVNNFKPELLGRARTIFNFEFDNDNPIKLVVQDKNFYLDEGRHSSPTITIYVASHRTLRDLLTGSADGMSVFMQGKYKSDSNIVLSQLLLYLFRP